MWILLSIVLSCVDLFCILSVEITCKIELGDRFTYFDVDLAKKQQFKFRFPNGQFIDFKLIDKQIDVVYYEDKQDVAISTVFPLIYQEKQLKLLKTYNILKFKSMRLSCADQMEAVYTKLYKLGLICTYSTTNQRFTPVYDKVTIVKPLSYTINHIQFVTSLTTIDNQYYINSIIAKGIVVLATKSELVINNWNNYEMASYLYNERVINGDTYSIECNNWYRNTEKQ